MIDENTVNHLARLSQIQLTDQEKLAIQTHLELTLSHFQKISAVNTDNIEPYFSPSDEHPEGHTADWVALRPDVIEKEPGAENIFQNAPDRTGNLFKVPPVIS